MREIAEERAKMERLGVTPAALMENVLPSQPTPPADDDESDPTEGADE